MNKWCFGLEEDEEFYGAGDTREDALSEGENAAEESGQDFFYIAQSKPIDLSKLINISGDSLIEMLVEDENNYEFLTEDAAEEWLSKVDQKAIEELGASVNKLVIAWIEKHGLQPKCFMVDKMEKITRPQAEKE